MICKPLWPLFLLAITAPGCSRFEPAPPDVVKLAAPSEFDGVRAGEERELVAVKFCWCPAGRFRMGSPGSEPDRRADEKQVEVTLTKGFWMAKYELTQGAWKRVVGTLPGEFTAELPEGDDYPVGNVNFAEAEAFCQRLTELARDAGELPADWEFRLPTEAQWEYACRAGTTTATAFGDSLSNQQANFSGKPYRGRDGFHGHGQSSKSKTADVAKHPQVFRHVGLLVNRPLGASAVPFTESSERC